MEGTPSHLASFLRDVPEPLRDEILDALEAADTNAGVPFVETLRLAADQQLARALSDPSDPLELLAADALITYVCQVTSEENPSTLSTLL